MAEKAESLLSTTKSPKLLARQATPFDLAARESKELIIGFSGAVGSGIDLVKDVLQHELEELHYRVVHIKLSNFIELMLKKELVKEWNPDEAPPNRLEKLQIAGNLLRKQNGEDFLAELAIASILADRGQVALKPGEKPPDPRTIVPTRTAYLLDQLKHPSEVNLLRKVYKNLFFLIGVLTVESQRRKNLNKILTPLEVTSAVERDRRDEDSNGQQLDKTLKLADFFVRNNLNTDALKRPLKRFLALLHGETSRTPTRDEYAMYIAYSAGLRSACLSRQVGAAITSADGTVISTGCNDVPKAGGGLYSEDDGDADQRCYRREGGKCFNDVRKDELGGEIQKLLAKWFAKDAEQVRDLVKQVRSSNEAVGVELERILGEIFKQDGSKEQAIAKDIRQNTGLRDLIEFSRAVHAEMDAIISLARRGGPSVSDGSLYTTTFPCHNCARHIVAAGIKRVLYIEPYEKSLALELHDDAIISDVDDAGASKVQFMHFEGVAPRQYQEFFLMKDERKKGSRAIQITLNNAPKVKSEYLDSYIDLESRILKKLVDQGLSQEQIEELTALNRPATSTPQQD